MDILQAANLTWPGIKEDVTQFIKSCLICQRIKVGHNLFHGESGHHLHGSYPMQSLSCDTVGPLPEDLFGNSYILAIVDNFSKFIHLFPIQSTESKEYVVSLVKHIGFFGVPKHLRTDGGTQFTANICSELSKMLKFDHLVIVPYHPQANGLIERRNAEIMKHLRALVLSRDIRDEWSKVLPSVQRILNFTKDSSIGVSPQQIIFGDMLPNNMSIDMSSIDGSVPVSEYLKMLKTKQ
jgi:hypothetical protein